MLAAGHQFSLPTTVGAYATGQEDLALMGSVHGKPTLRASICQDSVPCSSIIGDQIKWADWRASPATSAVETAQRKLSQKNLTATQLSCACQDD